MISNIAFLGALILFHLFLRRELDSSQADRGVFLLAFIPVSFYFSSAYAESLFLFLLLAVFVFCQRKRWLAAVVAARGRYEVALFALLQIALPLIYGYQSYPRYMMVTFALPMGALMLASGRALPVWIVAAILAALNFYWALLWFEGHGLLV